MPTFSPAWNCVPRWRTMMPQELIAAPPKTFTPSRLACESRPLRDEPPAFLCAIAKPHFNSGWRISAADRFDPDFGEILPMALGLGVMLAPAHLEDLDLVRAPMRKHDRGDAGARQ